MKLYSYEHEQDVLGTVKFDYRGYTISLSTMPVEGAVQELMIRKDGEDVWTDQMTWTDDVGCVEAIREITSLIDEGKITC
tara:strand:- start:434 stop:673 length:240 start_codon:yes stop_codon:yes gene_type:complete